MGRRGDVVKADAAMALVERSRPGSTRRRISEWSVRTIPGSWRTERPAAARGRRRKRKIRPRNSLIHDTARSAVAAHLIGDDQGRHAGQTPRSRAGTRVRMRARRRRTQRLASRQP
jgi:hypothetical protein